MPFVQSFPSVIDLALCTVYPFCYRPWPVYSPSFLLEILPYVQSFPSVIDLGLYTVFSFCYGLYLLYSLFVLLQTFSCVRSIFNTYTPCQILFFLSCWFSPNYIDPFDLYLSSLLPSLQIKGNLWSWKSRTLWPDMLKLTIQNKHKQEQCISQFHTPSLSPALHPATVPSVASLLALLCTFHNSIHHLCHLHYIHPQSLQLHLFSLSYVHFTIPYTISVTCTTSTHSPFSCISSCSLMYISLNPSLPSHKDGGMYCLSSPMLGERWQCS